MSSSSDTTVMDRPDTLEDEPSGLRELLGVRNFRFLWLGQIVSDFGDSLTYLSVLLLVNRLTGSTVALAGLAIALALPSLLFGLVAGVYVDRLDRRKVMIVADALRGGLVLALLFVRSADVVWLIYIVAFAHAAVGTLFTPAKSALLPQLVGEEDLLAANSVSQTSKIIFGLAGTATAGLIVGVTGSVWPAFILDSITFFVSMFLISRIALPPSLRPVMPNRGEVLDDLRTGVSTMLASRPLTAALITAGIAMLGIGAVNVLMVPLIVDELQVSETFFAAIEASQVAGMILAGVAIAVLASRFSPATLISLGMAGIGIATATISQVSHVWQMVVVLFIVGLLVTPLQASVATLTQTLVADELRGRVGGAFSALVNAASVASMAFAGLAAATVGVRNVFLLAGGIVIVGALLGAMMFRSESENLQPRHVGGGSEV